jgi:alkylation response protein AidB-like acyl-CoA dehydrogenase
MTTRCYVGDAMVFRTLGAVDQALESAGHDVETILKTIESFAIECSINKIWTSEALAYVVDEAVQIHGGYGYSKDLPVERAFRDARITRLYEGTSEINRIIIPPRLLNSPMVTDLFKGEFRKVTAPENSPFVSEYELLGMAKNLVVTTLKVANAAFGKGLKAEQEVMGHISDLACETYALESVMLRTGKIVAAKGEAECAVPIDMTRVFASDAAGRLTHSAKQVLATIEDKAETRALAQLIETIAIRPSFDTVRGRRRIADVIIAAGKYIF